MASGEIRLSDVNTKFLVTLKDGNDIFTDVASATTIQLIFKKPSGVIITRNATLYTDGSDGKIYYNTITDDLDEVGWWFIQAYVIVARSQFKSDIGRFRVHENL